MARLRRAHLLWAVPLVLVTAHIGWTRLQERRADEAFAAWRAQLRACPEMAAYRLDEIVPVDQWLPRERLEWLIVASTGDAVRIQPEWAAFEVTLADQRFAFERAPSPPDTANESYWHWATWRRVPLETP